MPVRNWIKSKCSRFRLNKVGSSGRRFPWTIEWVWLYVARVNWNWSSPFYLQCLSPSLQWERGHRLTEHFWHPFARRKLLSDDWTTPPIFPMRTLGLIRAVCAIHPDAMAVNDKWHFPFVSSDPTKLSSHFRIVHLHFIEVQWFGEHADSTCAFSPKASQGVWHPSWT